MRSFVTSSRELDILTGSVDLQKPARFFLLCFNEDKHYQTQKVHRVLDGYHLFKERL